MTKKEFKKLAKKYLSIDKKQNLAFGRKFEHIGGIDELYKALNIGGSITHTFKVDLNSDKLKGQHLKQIQQIFDVPCKTYIFDGEKYIELKP